MKKNEKLEVLGEFIAHITLGCAMFVALALMSGALIVFAHWYAGIVGFELGNLLILLEKAILYCDVVFFVWWLIYSTFKAIKDL